MLIVYDKLSGEIVDNTGTNQLWPEGPPDEFAYINTDAKGLNRLNLALLRLDDKEDSDLVELALTHVCHVENGNLVDDGPMPPPPPSPPSELDILQNAVDTLTAQILAMGVTP